MFKEQTIQAALKAQIDGEKVMVMIPDDDGYRAIPLELFFTDCRLLVDCQPGKVNSKTEETVSQPSLKQQKKVDVGKIVALHNAGWTGKAIAQEMKISPSVVSRYLNQAGNPKEKDHEEKI